MAHIPALPLDRDSRRPEKVLRVVEFCCTLVTDHGWEAAAIEAHLERHMLLSPGGRRLGSPAELTQMAMVRLAAAAQEAAVVAAAQEEWQMAAAHEAAMVEAAQEEWQRWGYSEAAGQAGEDVEAVVGENDCEAAGDDAGDDAVVDAVAAEVDDAAVVAAAVTAAAVEAAAEAADEADAVEVEAIRRQWRRSRSRLPPATLSGPQGNQAAANPGMGDTTASPPAAADSDEERWAMVVQVDREAKEERRRLRALGASTHHLARDSDSSESGAVTDLESSLSSPDGSEGEDAQRRKRHRNA